MANREDQPVRVVGTQVIGFGPAALGIAVGADRAGVFGELLASGLLFLERARSDRSAELARFPQVIDSNSLGADFMRGLSPAPTFGDVLKTRAGRTLGELEASHVPLRSVGELMNELARRVEVACASSSTSGVEYAANVGRLALQTNGLWATFTNDGRCLGVSRNVVLATGAEEDVAAVRALATDPAMVVPSGAVLDGDCSAIEGAVDAGFSIYVIGSSHSAFAALALILRHVGSRLRVGQLSVVHKRVRLYYPSSEAAELDGYEHEAAHVYGPTGEVNKFDGLRGIARTTYLDLVAGRETRARLVPLDAFSARARRSVYVSAVGYAPRQVTILDADGRRRWLASDSRGVRVDEGCRVLQHDGVPLPGVYGIGIGYARREGEGPARVGVNFFHGSDGEVIARALCGAALVKSSEARVGRESNVLEAS